MNLKTESSLKTYSVQIYKYQPNNGFKDNLKEKIV